ncbi:DNA-binding SARP family transcriptional activator [Actinoplanes tereljensis]|uniref:AfsR/SARP family transcriptional regulator n=1 Tax=Paractinoplanes tereljensis TaxID=571912 RepID=UPI0019424E63|nr:BTAD domain-containing putative transcriptional regulator [Actinoplanes tereljensis]
MGATIQLLGRPGIHRPGEQGPRPRGRKTWALLALASLSERPVPRHELVRMLFPDAGDAPAALRWSLSELRRGLRPDARIDGDPVALDLGRDTVVDAQQVLAGQADLDAGELLAGIDLTDCPEFDLWLSHQRERMAAALRASLRAAIDTRLAGHRPAEAVPLARRLVQLAPLEEQNHELLVRALAATGDRITAHAAASACAALFARELGVRPSPRVAAAGNAAWGLTVLPDGRRLLARLEVEAGKAALAAGATADGLERLRSAAAMAGELGDERVQGEAQAALGAAMVHSVALTEPAGVAALRRAAELARSTGDRATAATAGRELAFVALGSRAAAGSALLRAARELAGDDDGKLSAVLGVEAFALTDSGRAGPAAERFRRSIELADRAGEPRKAAWSLALLARGELIAGDLAAARDDIDRAMALVTAERWTAFQPFVLAIAAELDLHEGRLDEAGQRLAAAWTTAVRLGDPCWLSVTGRGLGLLAARRGNPAEAIRWLDGAYHRTTDRPPLICRWMDAATLDSICDVATAFRLPRARAAVAELASLGARARLPIYAARARAYQALS